MWDLYNELIDTIPTDLTVIDCIIGINWTLVKSELGTGTAMTVYGGKENIAELKDIIGIPLKELASSAKSWDMLEASLGMAAINAALNTTSEVSKLTGQVFKESEKYDDHNAFSTFLPNIKNKKVTVVGHFPNIDDLATHCQLSVLERNPQGFDFPDPACEYILSEQEVVFITGTAFTNKTMPRLLDLAKKSQIILVGPTVPISPVLFNYGVDIISSTVVLDEELVWKAVKLGGKMKAFDPGGQMVNIKNYAKQHS